MPAFVESAIFEIGQSAVIKSGVFCQMRKHVSKTRNRASCCKTERGETRDAGESKIAGFSRVRTPYYNAVEH